MILLVLSLGCSTTPTDTGDTSGTIDTGETGDTGDTGVASACDCSDPTTLSFTADVIGGFDDWSGNAVVWAIDTTANRVLVVGMAYEMGVGTIEFAPECEDPDELIGAWVAATPSSGSEDVLDYPLLGAAITTAAGVRSLPQRIGAVLLEGNLQDPVPTQVYVATDGGVALTRGDGGGDRLLGAFIFGATADSVGGDATVHCDTAPRLSALELRFPAGGSE